MSLNDLTIPQRIRNGLVSYWPLADYGAVEARSMLFDGRGPYDLTNVNSVTRAAGPSANLPDAANFVAASSQYFSNASPALANGGGSFEVSGWVYLATKTAFQAFISRWTTTGNQREFFVGYDNAGDRFIFRVSTDGGGAGVAQVNASTFGSPPAETFAFIRAWRDGAAGTLNIQVNAGDVDSTANASTFSGTGSTTIGTLLPGIFQLDGRLSALSYDIGAFNTQAEAVWLYNNGLGRYLMRGV